MDAPLPSASAHASMCATTHTRVSALVRESETACDVTRPHAKEISAELLKHPAIFRIGDVSQVNDGVVASGFDALDGALNGGWPVARLTELLCDHVGIGELSLLLPALPKAATAKSLAKATSKISNASTASARGHSSMHHSHRALWISQLALPAGMPCVAYAPALARAGIDLKALALVTTTSAQQTLWAMEQALLSGATRCVFAWIRETPHDFALRRISQAARKSESLCFLMRPVSAAKRASPAELRIAIQPATNGTIELTLLKRRGLLRETTLQLEPRELACLAPNRVPLSIATQQRNPLIDRSEIASVLNAAKNSSFDTPPKIRERSFLMER
jgi:protein ImuA